ncbi:MAG: hypothetical protein NC123_10380 [Butyrivibrio sp.]|nr:hypothetical protein [Butyrivibrio sp.]
MSWLELPVETSCCAPGLFSGFSTLVLLSTMLEGIICSSLISCCVQAVNKSGNKMNRAILYNFSLLCIFHPYSTVLLCFFFPEITAYAPKILSCLPAELILMMTGTSSVYHYFMLAYNLKKRMTLSEIIIFQKRQKINTTLLIAPTTFHRTL